jgi:signal transduction histidine kinase
VGKRREAYYTELRPGQYTFHVIACNNDGVWNEAGAMLNFSVAPAWFQTTWFLLLSVAFGICLVTAFYRFRVRRIAAAMNARFDERLAERTRIAQELHDTLLQGFLSASMHVYVATDRLQPDSPVKPILTRAIELMSQVIEEGRNAIRGLRSAHSASLNLEQSFARIQQEIGEATHGKEAGFRVIAEGEHRPLHPLLRDEVYRIGREALVNAFRHAKASQIEVTLTYTPDQLRLLVRDDGCGIDPNILSSGRDGHWGLSGMRERADRIRARLRVKSSASAGTEIELSVPGYIAFQGEWNARTSVGGKHS